VPPFNEEDIINRNDVVIEEDIITWNTYNQLGNSFKELKQYDKAILAFESALVSSNDIAANISIYINIGDVYRVIGDYDKSIETYMTVIKSGAHIPSSLYNNFGVTELDRGCVLFLLYSIYSYLYAST